MSSATTCDICGFLQKTDKGKINDKERIRHYSFNFPLDLETMLYSKTLFQSFDFCYTCSHKFAVCIEDFFWKEKAKQQK